MPSSSLSDSLPSYILSKDQLIQGREQWEQLVDESTDLASLFPSGSTVVNSRLAGVSFPMTQIEELLSTVGGDEVRVHFLVTGDGSTDPYTFRIALSVAGLKEVDSESRRQLSAYYVAEAVASAASVARRPRSAATTIPLPLVDNWISNWEDTSIALDSAVFCNLGAPLRGYTYPIKDFVDALFSEQTTTSPDTLYLMFGLHCYYAMDEEGEVSAQQQFGVIMTLDNGQASTAKKYFDMSKPCPPMCGAGL